VVAFLTTLRKAQPESAREIMSTIGAELLGQTCVCVNVARAFRKEVLGSS
jgi:hypothetical protein